MRRIVWTDEAISHLETIAAYIEEFNPLAAQRLALRLVNAAESLVEHPERGRRVNADERELAIISPYLIRYQVTDREVVILRVRHGARRPL